MMISSKALGYKYHVDSWKESMLPPTFSFSLVALGALNQSRRAKTLWYFGGKILQLVSMASSRQQQQVWWFQCVDKLYKVTQVRLATAHDGLWVL